MPPGMAPVALGEAWPGAGTVRQGGFVLLAVPFRQFF